MILKSVSRFIRPNYVRNVAIKQIEWSENIYYIHRKLEDNVQQAVYYQINREIWMKLYKKLKI